MSATDELLPIPPQPEISEGNKVFHQKAYDLYKWMRTKLGPSIIETVDLLRNTVTGAFSATTTENLTIVDTGELSFPIEPGRSFKPGTPVRLAYTTTPTNYVDGITKTYDAVTGAFVMYAQGKNGAGNYSNWTLSIIASATSGIATLLSNKFTGLQTFANEVTVASDTTIDLTAAGSNQGRLTGTAVIENVTMAQGAVLNYRAAGTPTLKHSTTLKVQGQADYVCTAGDWLEFKKDTDGNVHVAVTPVTGKSLYPVKTAANDASLSATGDAVSGDWVKLAIPLKAWVNFNGTGTVAIRASKNVSSITDNGTGDYTINFTNPIVDANYCVTCALNAVAGSSTAHNIVTQTTGGITINTFRWNGTSFGSNADMNSVEISVFR